MEPIASNLTDLERTWRMEPAVCDATRRRARRLEESLQTDSSLCIRRTLIGGSFAKGVETCITDDLDIYAYIDFTGDAWSGLGPDPRSDAVLDRLQELLEKRFWAPVLRGRMSVRGQRHSVGLRYRETGALSYDIVPLAHRPGIPGWVELPRRGARRWIRTSVRRQLELFAERARLWPGLPGAVRLLKVWCCQLPAFSDDSSWSAYAFEVISMRVCEALPHEASPGDIFLATMQWIESTRLRTLVDLKRWPSPTPSPARSCAIVDPAYALNELTPKPVVAARRTLIEAARATLRALVSGSVLSLDEVADIVAPQLALVAVREGA